MNKPFRLCREVNGEYVDIMEFHCEFVEEAIALYRLALESCES